MSEPKDETTNPGLTPDSLATQALNIVPKKPEGLKTQVLATTGAKAGAVPETVTTKNLTFTAPFPETRIIAPMARPSRTKNWVFGILAVLILGGTLGYYFLNPSGELPAMLQAKSEEIPPVLRPYLDKAAQGDSGSMRMLGTMYYNGLNIPQNRKEGIKWYRKAAEAGSVAAKKDLEQLGLSVDEK
jgi:hypothetical protein